MTAEITETAINEDRPVQEDPVRVLIVDDHPIMRRGLRTLFESEGFAVDEAADGRSALDLVSRTKPRVIILDLILYDGDSLSWIPKIRAAYSGTSVLIYSGSDEFLHAKRAIQGGAEGYVMKGGKIDDIVVATRCVLDGGVYLSERMQKRGEQKDAK